MVVKFFIIVFFMLISIFKKDWFVMKIMQIFDKVEILKFVEISLYFIYRFKYF